MMTDEEIQQLAWEELMELRADINDVCDRALKRGEVVSTMATATKATVEAIRNVRHAIRYEWA